MPLQQSTETMGCVCVSEIGKAIWGYNFTTIVTKHFRMHWFYVECHSPFTLPKDTSSKHKC